jgi:hypothetical protein
MIQSRACLLWDIRVDFSYFDFCPLPVKDAILAKALACPVCPR